MAAMGKDEGKEMKRILGLVAILAALVLALAMGTNALAVWGQAGDIVIYRVGDGTQPLTNNGMYVYLDEYTVSNTAYSYDPIAQAGNQTFSITYQGTIAMPQSWYGANAPVVSDGFSQYMGELTTSVDGRFVVLTGYGATLTAGATPTYQLTNSALTDASATAVVARVVGLVDGYGHIDTTTTQTNLNEQGDELRGAASLEGTNIWLTGSSDQTTYAVRAQMTSTQVCNSTQLQTPYRNVNIFQNALYINRQSSMAVATNTSAAVNTLPAGGGLPTSYVNSNFTVLGGVELGTESAYPNHAIGNASVNFMMFNIASAHNSGAAPDTLYVADNVQDYYGLSDTHGGGVLKYCWISGMWSNVGVIGSSLATMLTGVQSGTNVTLYITSGGTQSGGFNLLSAYYDTSGFGGVPEDSTGGNGADAIHITSYPTILNSHGVSNVGLVQTRGITTAPQGGENSGQSGNWVTNAIKHDLSLGPPYGVVCSGNAGGPFYATNVYSVANFGTGSLSVNVSGVPSFLTGTFSASSTINPLGSITYTVVANSQANTLGATQIGSFTLVPASGGVSWTIPYDITVNSFNLTPDSNCVAVGNACGTFTFQPAGSNIYTLTNVTSNPLQWGATISNNSPWVTLSSTGTTLGANSSIAITALVTAASSTNTIGTYQDIILFSNLALNPPQQLQYEYVRLQVGFGFFDDFSTYAPGNVVGQNNWTASQADTDNPVQITTFNGSGPLQYVSPGGSYPATAQQPRKNFTGQAITNAFSGASPTYGIVGMLITVTNGSPSPNYLFDIAAGLNGANYYQADTGMLSNSPTTYLWTLQLNQPNSSATQGNTSRNFGTQYQVYIIGDEVNSNAWVFVNPTLSDVTNPTGASDYDIYLNAATTPCNSCAGATTNLGSVVLGQYGASPGYAIQKVAASTNATDVYNFISNGGVTYIPVAASFTPSVTSGQAPLTVNFTDNSSGTPGPTSWYWTFDNVPDTSTSESPSWTYNSAGTYTVQLIASNGCSWSTNQQVITVNSAQTPFASWQTYYFSSGTLNANAAPGADPYDSGMSNTNKFMAGFGTNKMASLHIISVAKANSTNIVVTFLGASGDSSYSPGVFSRTNILEYTTGKPNGSYSNNFAQVPGTPNVILTGGTGVGYQTNITDVGGATSSTTRYYRVRVLLP